MLILVAWKIYNMIIIDTLASINLLNLCFRLRGYNNLKENY
jgi:hypothetical protein